MVGQANDKNDTDNHDDQLLSVDEFPSESITEKSKRELPDDVADVCCCVDCSSKKKGVIGGLLVARAWQAAPVSGEWSVSRSEDEF